MRRLICRLGVALLCALPLSIRLLAAPADAPSAAAPSAAAPSAEVPAAAAPSAAVPSDAIASIMRAAVVQGFAGEILIADRRGVLFHAAEGLADRSTGRAYQRDEPWRWCSVSKQVLALLTLRLVDSGQLALDDTVAQSLPALADSAAGPVTVRQLMMHLSGLPNPDETPANQDGIPGFYVSSPATSVISAGSANAASPANAAVSDLAFCTTKPTIAPGTEFQYNNCDSLVLGALLERVSGHSLAQQLAVVQALPGLAGLHLAEAGEDVAMPAYAKDGAAVPQPSLARFGISGALIGTASALLAFDQALLRGTLLSPAATTEMWTGVPRWGYVALGAWAFPAKLPGCASPVRLVERRGDIGGIQVRNILAPDLGAAVLVFTNSADFEFGEIWQGRGFSYELLAAALCH